MPKGRSYSSNLAASPLTSAGNVYVGDFSGFVWRKYPLRWLDLRRPTTPAPSSRRRSNCALAAGSGPSAGLSSPTNTPASVKTNSDSSTPKPPLVILVASVPRPTSDEARSGLRRLGQRRS